MKKLKYSDLCLKCKKKHVLLNIDRVKSYLKTLSYEQVSMITMIPKSTLHDIINKKSENISKRTKGEGPLAIENPLNNYPKFVRSSDFQKEAEQKFKKSGPKKCPPKISREFYYD